MPRNMRYVESAAPGLPFEEVHIEGLPEGGRAEVADGSVTTAKIADGAVTRDKIAGGVIPSPYALPAATTSVLGGVRQAAHVDGASGTVQQVVDALVAAGIMAGA